LLILARVRTITLSQINAFFQNKILRMSAIYDIYYTSYHHFATDCLIGWLPDSRCVFSYDCWRRYEYISGVLSAAEVARQLNAVIVGDTAHRWVGVVISSAIFGSTGAANLAPNGKFESMMPTPLVISSEKLRQQLYRPTRFFRTTVLPERVIWLLGLVLSLSGIATCTHGPQGVIIVGIYMSSNIFYLLLLLYLSRKEVRRRMCLQTFKCNIFAKLEVRRLHAKPTRLHHSFLL